MTEGLDSAVSVPNQDPLPSPDQSIKRKSSITPPDTKRRRLSSHDQNTNGDTNQSPDNDHNRRRSSAGTATSQTEAGPLPPREERPQRRPGNRRDEERKRGQRLFGNLLGTLSQGPNSAAQKRRADIERRQHDKLKLQDEEYDGLKKKRKEERMVVRKREVRAWEEAAIRTRHANLLAMARFLRTKTEPVLYYKPWQLRSRDENMIQDQIDEAEDTIAREVAEFEARYPPEREQPIESDASAPHEYPQADKEEEEKPAEHTPLPEETKPDEQEPKEKDKEETKESKDTEGEAKTETPHEASDRADANTERNGQGTEDAKRSTGTIGQPNEAPDQADDGGEVVEEDKEDTVIY